MGNCVKVVIVGISGRMGQMLFQAVEENPKTILSGAVEIQGHEWIGSDVGASLGYKKNGVLITDSALEVFAEADAIVDFTSPSASVFYSKLTAQARIPHIIGTTGFTEEQLKELFKASCHTPIIRAGNMSLGVNLLVELSKKISKVLTEEFDIEIVEMHHNKKVDSPSGTALMLGEAVANGRSVELDEVKEMSRNGITGHRKKGSIGFSSIRGGDVVGEHEVIFAASGERITLKHLATDRMIFARGAIKAVLWGVTAEPGEYGMSDVLNLT